MRIILASKSPRRQQLLRSAGLNFEVHPSDADETAPDGIAPDELVMLLAKRKAHSLGSIPGAVIIASDTVVACGGRILGKPDGFDGALEMLRFLSGKTQDVWSGVCITGDGKETVFAEKTEVVFRELSDGEIISYIEEEKPFDKAGSYAVQSGGGGFVSRLHGDYNNVVGLPLGRVLEALETVFGILPPQK